MIDVVTELHSNFYPASWVQFTVDEEKVAALHSLCKQHNLYLVKVDFQPDDWGLDENITSWKLAVDREGGFCVEGYFKHTDDRADSRWNTLADLDGAPSVSIKGCECLALGEDEFVEGLRDENI